MHVSYSRLLLACFGLVAGSVSGRPVLGCEDIAALSTDGRFVVLDGDTLALKDVGNLWFLGIRGVDYVIPGSTLARAGVISDRRVDPTTGMLVKPESASAVGPESALAVIRDAGRSLSSSREVPVVVDSSSTGRFWWTSDLPGSHLIHVHGPTGRSVLTIYDASLNKQAELAATSAGSALPASLPFSVVCAHEKQFIIGTSRERMVAGDDSVLRIDPLAGAGDDFRLTDVSIDCRALMVKPDDSARKRDINSERLTMRLINLAANTVQAEFHAKRVAKSVLFAEGGRLLQQALFAKPEGEVGYRTTPTRQVSVLDTESGKVIRSAELKSTGEVSRLFCRGDSERVVLAEPNELHVLDLASLSIIASKAIPFERYFVF